MKKILIIEDEFEIQKLLKDLFLPEIEGAEAVYANDGLEGFLQANLQKFDLICTDHLMPFYKGADLCIALRQKKGPNQHTPIIMISAHIPETEENLHSLQDTFFIQKPIDFSRLIRYAKMAMK